MSQHHLQIYPPSQYAFDQPSKDGFSDRRRSLVGNSWQTLSSSKYRQFPETDNPWFYEIEAANTAIARKERENKALLQEIERIQLQSKEEVAQLTETIMRLRQENADIRDASQKKITLLEAEIKKMDDRPTAASTTVESSISYDQPASPLSEEPAAHQIKSKALVLSIQDTIEAIEAELRSYQLHGRSDDNFQPSLPSDDQPAVANSSQVVMKEAAKLPTPDNEKTASFAVDVSRPGRKSKQPMAKPLPVPQINHTVKGLPRIFGKFGTKRAQNKAADVTVQTKGANIDVPWNSPRKPSYERIPASWADHRVGSPLNDTKDVPPLSPSPSSSSSSFSSSSTTPDEEALMQDISHIRSLLNRDLA
ncbi:uncharacterized protein BYT42DRAFT_642633 [Radiomyces spectabilis]|uniref:uncharacterized protein n=1 Tax=Radiomyces spectabilis TaxID=64574 RepID=UPI00221FDB79|nr:uncharacterized protein BYT42DRAFT_642633 [Radiomyces spectabilis]KAI8388406.1 hypothetical protein BYT42DRAFT_642633 [Radiomyces spectabilis]